MIQERQIIESILELKKQLRELEDQNSSWERDHEVLRCIQGLAYLNEELLTLRLSALQGGACPVKVLGAVKKLSA